MCQAGVGPRGTTSSSTSALQRPDDWLENCRAPLNRHAVQGDITGIWTGGLARASLTAPMTMKGVTTESFHFCLKILLSDQAQGRRTGQPDRPGSAPLDDTYRQSLQATARCHARTTPAGCKRRNDGRDPGAIQADRRQGMGVHRGPAGQLPRSVSRSPTTTRATRPTPRSHPRPSSRCRRSSRPQTASGVPLWPVSRGKNFRVRRRGAGPVGLRRPRHEPDEPHPRGEREIRLRPGRAGGQLLRPVQLPPGARP